MLILFGSYARGDWVEDLDPETLLYRYQSDLDLFVITETPRQASKIERGRMGRGAPMSFEYANHLNRAETHHPQKPLMIDFYDGKNDRLSALARSRRLLFFYRQSRQTQK
ncbi:MAG: nucleotidyltransferase domain-containing protein [Candidatus Thiosymbion ectosymbiont of Robbea hypermnestra]|nr:nucleotidyltransferase domain-containing protein [Candidatus Thiosymbion ectosymbiont of Robbea hypermnestra]